MYTKRTFFTVQAAVIAALYVVLSMFAGSLNLASGAIQCRFSEALTILPFFTPAAIPGLTIGCFISNVLLGSLVPDVIFGTIATLIGAVGTYYLRHTGKLYFLPPIVSNTIIVPQILKYAYGVSDLMPFLILTVGIGEIISVVLFGGILLKAIMPVRSKLFSLEE